MLTVFGERCSALRAHHHPSSSVCASATPGGSISEREFSNLNAPPLLVLVADMSEALRQDQECRRASAVKLKISKKETDYQ